MFKAKIVSIDVANPDVGSKEHIEVEAHAGDIISIVTSTTSGYSGSGRDPRDRSLSVALPFPTPGAEVVVCCTAPDSARLDAKKRIYPPGPGARIIGCGVSKGDVPIEQNHALRFVATGDTWWLTL